MIVSDSDLPPDRKIVKARANLIRRDPFFGGLSLRLKLKPITRAQAARLKITTLATDGRYLYYYPEGVAKQPFVKLVTIVAHEGGHIGFKHHLRRGSREFKLWNHACDIAINNILRSAGYDMPDVGHYRHDLNGMSAEKIYAILKKEAQDAQDAAQQQSQPQISGGSGIGAKGDSELQGDQDDVGQDTDDTEQDRSEMDTGDDGQESPEPDLDPDADGNYQIDPDLLEDDDEIANLPDVPDLGEELSDGVVLDAPADLTSIDAEQELDLGIEAAYNSAKNAGRVPGSIEILIESQRRHKIDYRDLMREWLDEHLFPGDYSWKRPNRRYLQYDIILPGLVPEQDIPNVAFICDTSISVSDKELRVYSREVSGVLEEFPCEFDVVYCDTDVRHTQHFSTDDLPITMEAYGRGGTRFLPAFEYVRDHYPDVDAILYFTDMGAWDWKELETYDPGVPVLWMNTNENENERQVPFGEIIPLKIDEKD